jgi:hypothetical protein
MVINIENTGLTCLSQIFKTVPAANFKYYQNSGECITIVDGYRLVAEIMPWNEVVEDYSVLKTFVKYHNYNDFAWLPFAVMVSRSLATLFDERFNTTNSGKTIRVTKP